MNWIKTIYKESVVLAAKRSKQLQFVGLIFLLFGLIFYRWYGFAEPFYWRLACIAIISLGFLILPQLVYPILIGWFFIGKFIGEIISTIFLSLLYFALFWMVKWFVRVDVKPGWKPKNREQDYSSMG